jgi:dynein heavy chain 1
VLTPGIITHLLYSLAFAITIAAVNQTFSYSVSHELTYHAKHVGSIALIKRGPTIDTSRPLQTQVQFINLPGPAANESGLGLASPYEALHSYIHYAVSPYFNAYVSSKSGVEGGMSSKRPDDKDGKMGIPMAKKKIAELELSLLHLQQNVEIPEISLSIHPVVQQAIDEVRI